MLDSFRAVGGAGRAGRADLRRSDAAAGRRRRRRDDERSPPRPTGRSVIAGPWLAETLRGAARRRHGARRRSRARPCRRRCGPISRPACAGCTCCPGSAWAPASPTTWAWARRSRCWRCCWCSAAATASGAGAQPAGRAGVAARQLGGGDRALRARPARADRASVGDAGRGAASTSTRGAARRARPGDHQLRHAAAPAGAARQSLAPRDPRRGAGDQEPGRQADPRGQGS